MSGAPADPIRLFQFESFTRPDLVHAVFQRHGGVSPEPWHTLNFGTSTGDSAERTAENRRLAFGRVGRDSESMADLWQVHSARVLVADRPQRGLVPDLQGDGLVTDRPQVTLFMRFADCVPIFLYDPRSGAVGLVHAGWKGTVLRAAAAGVRMLEAAFGARPADLIAGIGPSIGPDHYEVGPEVAGQVQAAYPARWPSLLLRKNGSTTLDLWQANRVALEEAGVGQIEIAGLCTACNPKDYFSHRAEKGRTGRFGALLALRGG